MFQNWPKYRSESAVIECEVCKALKDSRQIHDMDAAGAPTGSRKYHVCRDSIDCQQRSLRAMQESVRNRKRAMDLYPFGN